MDTKSPFATRRLNRPGRFLKALAGLVLLAGGLVLGGQPVVQEFFVPIPEADLQTSLRAIDQSSSPVGNTIRSTISIVVGTPGTVIYYDNWEDGYENDLANPVQTTTQVWGDGNDANGIAPGFAHDPVGLPAGTVITLQNDVALPRNPTVIRYDGRDRIGASAPIVVTRAGWGTAPGTVLCSAMEVYDTAHYGTAFTTPVGTDVITTAGAQLFSYSSLHITAAQNNTIVTIDKHGDGSVIVGPITLQRGGTYLVSGGVTKGATVTATKPVLVEEVTGHIGSTFSARTFAIRPTSQWDSSYYAPVGTTLSSEPHNVFIYNPTASPLTVQYAARSGSGSFSVPAKGVHQFTMPMNSGAHFYTTGTTFYAVGANDSGSTDRTGSENEVHDWGYALLPEEALTTQVVVGWAPGADGNPPSYNGSPVWVTPTRATTLYVNYSGNYASGPFTASNGYKYNVAYTLSAYQSQTIYNSTTKNMTGARLFTTDGVTFAAAWGEDPSTAGPGSPFLDLGTTLIPFPVPEVAKGVTIAIDTPPTGAVNAADTLRYTVRVSNDGMLGLYNTVVLDNLPSDLTYVPGTTTTNYPSASAVAVTDEPTPPATTPFPLASPGFVLPYIGPGSYVDVIFEATVNIGASGSIVNVASATASGVTLSSSTTTPVTPGGPTACAMNFTDPIGTVVTTYAEGAGIYVTVTDADRNTDPTTADTVSVVVLNLTSGDLETITLTETGINTGVFRNSSPLPSSKTSGLSQQDGTLNARAGDSLQVQYNDTLFPPDPCTASATIAYTGLTKKLYLSDPSQNLDRVDPVTTGDVTTAETATMGLTSSWAYKAQLTFDNGSRAESLVNFPVLVHLTAGNFDFSHAQVSGQDIRFFDSDGTTPLSYEIESWTGSEAFIWVKVPQIDASSTTDSIWMRYGNPSAADGQNATAVWDTNYKGVWHLKEATGATSADSTSNGNNATPLNSPTQGAAKIDGGLTFNGLASGMEDNVSSTFGLGTASVTMECWAYLSSTSLHGAFIKIGGISPNQGYGIGVGGQVAGAYAFHNPGNQILGLYEGNRWMDAGTFTTGWHHFAFVIDASQHPHVYYDGTQIYSDAGTVPLAPASSITHIGGYTGSVGENRHFNGTLDEVRVSSSVRSANWINAQYASMTDSLITYGSEQAVLGGEPSVTFTQATAMCSGLTLPAGSLLGTVTYFTVNSGAMPASPNITATIAYGATTIATSSSCSSDGSKLTFTFPALGSAVTVPAGQAISLQITTAEAGVTFGIDYDSTSAPSAISLPTTTVINVDSLGVYNAAYSGGSLITSAANGTEAYIRAAVSDPFGTSDITSLDVTITGPAGASVTLNSAVGSSGCSDTFEYPWLGPASGTYSITVTAHEGTEGTITSSASTAFQVNSLDLGTPSTTTFTDGSGNPMHTYPTTSSQVCVQVVDQDQNTNPAVAETVTAVVTTSTGDRETVTLTETGVNTGVFQGCITANTGSPVPGDGFLSLNYGANLTATYTDPTDATDVSSDNALVPTAPSPTPVVTVSKTLTNPAGGTALENGTVEYDVVVANPGSVSLPTVAVTDTFPAANLSFVSATVTPDSTTPAGTLTWNNVGPLASGESVTIHLVFTAVAAGSSVDNSVSVSGTASAGPATASVTILNPRVTVTKTLLSPASGPAYINDLVTFRITLYNPGTTIITTLPLQDQYSSSCFRFVSATIAPDAQGGGVMLWNNLGPLGVGATRTVDVTLKVIGDCNPADNIATVSGAVDASSNPLPTVPSDAQITLIGSSLSGLVWNDANGNQTDDGGDAPIVGAVVYVDLNNDGVRNPTEPFAVTDANGQYTIDGLAAGTYTVRVDTSTLGGVTTPTYDYDGIGTPNVATVTLGRGVAQTGVNFGYWSGLVQGTIYTDTNANGTYEEFVDTPLSNVQVKITASDGAIYYVTTGPTGYFSQVVAPGATTVDVVDSTLPSGGVLATGNTDPKSVTVPGGGSATANTGYTFPAGTGTVQGTIYLDLDGSGTFNAGDAPLPGVQVTITTSTSGTLTVTTDANGFYSATVPAGLTGINVVDGTLPAGVTLTTGNSDPKSVTVTGSGTNPAGSGDTGYVLPPGYGLVNGVVYKDVDGDGLYAGGTDIPIANVPVVITKSDTTQVTVTTDANGYFQAVVPFGSTTVNVQQGNVNFPAGYVLTTDAHNQGTNPTTVTVPDQGVASEDTGYLIDATLSGTVFDDANGLTDGTINGAGSNAGGTLYAYLVDNGGHVAASSTVAADGTYSFINIVGGTYTVVLSTATGVNIGDPGPAASLPANWVNTGEGITAGGDGTPDGVTSVTITTAHTTGVNFGIDQLPDSGTATAVSQLNSGGTSVAVPASLFSGTDPDGTVTGIQITSFPANATGITINGTPYTSGTFPGGGVTVPANGSGQPTQTISVVPNAGVVSVVISYAAIDNAGEQDPTPGSVTLPFTVGPLDHFGVSNPGTVTAGTAFTTTTITAQDINNNTVIGFIGTVDLTETGGGAGGTVSPSRSGTFTLGVLANPSLTLTKAEIGRAHV